MNEDKIIVYTDIVGDLLHYGHVKLFENCKKMGTHLIVGVCSDELVESYKRKPILNMDERTNMISSIKFVDGIIKNPPCPITKEFIQKHNIDLVVHADGMPQKNLNHWYKAPMELGKFKTVSYTKGISTSEILNRIKTRIQNGTL